MEKHFTTQDSQKQGKGEVRLKQSRNLRKGDHSRWDFGEREKRKEKQKVVR